MALPRQNPTAVVRTLAARSDKARELALQEVKQMKKDLAAAEKMLSGQAKPGTAAGFDLIHGALEISRHLFALAEHEALQEGLAEALETARDEDYLAQAGATLLKKPAGWHWISQKGEMHFLAKPGETVKAAQVLRVLRSPIRKKDKAEKAPAAAEAAEASETAEA